MQAAIEARIDRLSAPARQTFYAASVIGARFDEQLLVALSIGAMFDELLSSELIDQVRFTADAEFAFRHPLIRAVAYESQLKSDRAQWHRRLATAIEEVTTRTRQRRTRRSLQDIFQAAGDLHTAYRLAHARRRVGDPQRHPRRMAQLGAGTPHRRRTT